MSLRLASLTKWLATFYAVGCIFFLSTEAFSQSSVHTGDMLSTQQFIAGCAAYRSDFIDDLSGVLIEFNALCDSLQSLSGRPDPYDIFREQFIHDVLHFEIRHWSEVNEDALPDSIQLDKGHIQEFQKWARQNHLRLVQLNFLMANRIIESNQTFRLTNLKDFWEEIRSYDLKAGQVFLNWCRAGDDLLQTRWNRFAIAHFPYRSKRGLSCGTQRGGQSTKSIKPAL